MVWSTDTAFEPAAATPGQADAALGVEIRWQRLVSITQELRQTTQSVSFYVEALRSGASNADRSRLIERLAREVSGLGRLVERALEIARLDAGQVPLDMRPVDLKRLLETIDRFMSGLAAERGMALRFRCSARAVVWADPEALARVLLNLLSNALRHGGQGSVLMGVRRRGRHWSIEVHDRGGGIDPQRLAHLTLGGAEGGPLRDDAAPKHGTGLVVAHQLARAMRSGLQLRSREGRGTCCSLELPAVDDGAVGRARQAERAALAGQMVLVVEPDIDALVSTHALLSAFGCFVLLARTLDEARAVIDASDRLPDAIVAADEGCGDMRGEQIVAALSAAIGMPCPAVLLSSVAGSEEAAARMDEDALLRVLARPVSPDRMIGSLLDMLTNAAAMPATDGMHDAGTNRTA